MDVVDPRRRDQLRAWAIASMVANAALIITGGLVRLTKSGLGCPTWPKCRESYLPDAALGVHGVVEFSNRLLTFALIALAIGTFLAARRVSEPLRRRATRLAVGIGLGIMAQAVVGGASVLTKLNPWVVGLHLIVSLGLVALCVWLVHDVSARPTQVVAPRGRAIGLAAVTMGYVSMALGSVVTGAGPNSGDDGARRSGLDLMATARIHSLSVWLLVALTVAAIILLRRSRAGRMAVGVLIVELAMGLIGYLQYFNNLPIGLVIAHMVGVAVFSIAIAHLLYALVGRPPQETADRSTTTPAVS